ncbi:dihydrolipoyl dehydrogenase family protein [Nocardia terpenica]|uniref:FAD-dependent oxidoreductase n=1 Tax=Nocardia terpenica TaxID=455432 RepID=A0A6G9Z4I6_9NOCA|nr:FAD-dependent oxidoreductase [Nocardia terpenica]QIS19923.1 FAD-dependent oxidoreductase [Nocardia terpenica]
MTHTDCDLLVVGGGSAGLAAAETGVRAGARVLLVADGEIGGDCTFTGCVPSKTLIEAAAQGLSYSQATARVRAAIGRIAATETADVLRKRGIEVLRGRARFTASRRVDVDGRSISSARIVIATGSVPAIPPIDGLADVAYLTTDTVFEQSDPPDSLAILGGGPTGCELAQAFSRLGVRVSVVEFAPRLLPGTDADAAGIIAEVFAREGITVHTATTVRAVSGKDGTVALHTDSGPDITAQRLLVATGRRPDTTELGLDAAGIRTGAGGFISVDRHLATTAPGVYAAGDITGHLLFTHAAYEMGRVAAGSALRRWRRPVFDPTVIPQVVFTDPEIATVGATESEITDPRARLAYLRMDRVDRAITADRTDGFVKLLAGPRRILGNTGGGRVLGATIVCERAGELVHEPALALRTGMFTGRLAQTVHAYPTWSTAIQQAAAQFFGYGPTPRAITQR